MNDLYCTVSGEGRPIVLLHGWGLNGAVWQDLAAALAEDACVCVPDLPGHGRSARLALEGLTETGSTLLGHVQQPAVWIGWSFGALVALALASRWPECVRKLVLIGTNPRFVQGPDWPAAVAMDVFTQFAHDLGRDYAGTLQRFLSLQLGTGPAARPALRRLREAVFAHGLPAPDALASGLRLLAGTDLRGDVPAIRAPALIVHGGRDTLAPLAAGTWLAAALPQARLMSIPDAGHAPFLSHPAVVAAAIREFIHE